MALRIHQSVVRGEIDNRRRGRIEGWIALVGVEQPVTLELTGNCLRDLAGCVVRFENPQPMATEEEANVPALLQRGVAGEITASRKVRVLDVPLEEATRLTRSGTPPPEHFANALYLEWFSEATGRVVIESSDYKIEVSPAEWKLSAEDEEQQIASCHEALRAWLERLDQIDLPDPEESEFEIEDEEPLDEFGYEKFMREADARTDKYMKLFEKYEGHPDREKIVAREMGWIWLEETLEADERGALPKRKREEIPPLEPNPLTEGVDWVRDKDGHIHHPLTKRAFESGVAMWHFCDDQGLMEENGDSDLFEMVFQFQTAGAKIAGALDSLAYDEDDSRDGGFVVAALKRALNYLHTSMAAADKVAQKNLLPPERLDAFRAELFEVREKILELMQRFRAKRF
jgi:hypothetical protein